MKKLLRKILPEKFLLAYHYFLARLAVLYYRRPAKKMIIIGVTGTKGKTSTGNFIWSCLSAGGRPTGLISTANIRIGSQESLNHYHMTMPGPFIIQNFMAQMVKAGCRFCVVETTSEGLKQYRHLGIDYDLAVFTNLTPEHLSSHGGSFESYKKMKARMFAALSSHTKVLDGQMVEKVIIANQDSSQVDYFLKFGADKKITFALEKPADFQADNIKETADGVEFTVAGQTLAISILGRFNIYNALPAVIIARLFGLSDQALKTGLAALKVIPGRMEKIDQGQDFTVIVDYAHEKESMSRVLETANNMKPPGGRVIVLLGAEGGGRDKAKRPVMGELAAKLANYVVVSNVDPYEDDPQEILSDIAQAAEAAGRVRDRDLLVIEDRREGIRQALALAKAGDIVLITGKGAEQSMIIGGRSIAWDDREVVRTELKSLLTNRVT